MHIIVVKYDFDPMTLAYRFDMYEKAKAYLHKLWEKCYNEEIAEGSDLCSNECYHEDDYAQLKWTDGERVQFILTFEVPYDEEFFEGDWRRYL